MKLWICYLVVWLAGRSVGTVDGRTIAAYRLHHTHFYHTNTELALQMMLVHRVDDMKPSKVLKCVRIPTIFTIISFTPLLLWIWLQLLCCTFACKRSFRGVTARSARIYVFQFYIKLFLIFIFPTFNSVNNIINEFRGYMNCCHKYNWNMQIRIIHGCVLDCWGDFSLNFLSKGRSKLSITVAGWRVI